MCAPPKNLCVPPPPPPPPQSVIASYGPALGHVPKKINFDPTHPPGSGVGAGGGLRIKYLQPCCCICV